MKKNRSIVVVDDDHNQADLLKEFLGANGYDVDVAYTGEEGLQRVMDLRPDLVILDFVLPDISGADVCAELRAGSTTQHIPVILCSAQKFSVFDKVIGFRAGADDYLIRPFDLSELLARIEAILRRSQVHPKKEHVAVSAPIDKKPILETISVITKEVHAAPPAPRIFKRIWEVLNHPWKIFSDLNDHEDFLTAVVVVLGTPIILSFSKLFGGGGFDSWIGGLSLGVVVHLVMWCGVAGVLHMTMPFQGINLPMRQALTMAGLASSPRFLESVLGLLYEMIAAMGLGGDRGTFSSGIDIFPGMPTSGVVSFFSHVGIFDFWSVGLTLIAAWTISRLKKPQWNTLTILIGVTCVLLSALSKF